MPITITATFVLDDIDELHETLLAIREIEPLTLAFAGDVGGFNPTEPDGDPDDPLTCSWCGFTTPYDDLMEDHIAERHTEGVAAAQAAVAACTGPCIDPFCEVHGEHALPPRQDPLEIQQISNAIMAFAENLLHDDIDGPIVAHELLNFVHVIWEGSDLARFIDGDDATWWLGVAWAMQDWKARGINLPTALSMTRGVIADLQVAVES